jgi:hypothetical protein
LIMVEETSMKVRCVSWGLSCCCNVQGDNEVMLGETFYGQQDIHKVSEFQAIHKLTNLKGPYDKVSFVIILGILLATCYILVVCHPSCLVIYFAPSMVVSLFVLNWAYCINTFYKR